MIKNIHVTDFSDIIDKIENIQRKYFAEDAQEAEHTAEAEDVPETPFEEGIRATEPEQQKEQQMIAAEPEPEKEQIDPIKLVVYSEIMKPRYEVYQ